MSDGLLDGKRPIACHRQAPCQAARTGSTPKLLVTQRRPLRPCRSAPQAKINRCCRLTQTGAPAGKGRIAGLPPLHPCKARASRQLPGPLASLGKQKPQKASGRCKERSGILPSHRLEALCLAGLTGGRSAAPMCGRWKLAWAVRMRPRPNCLRTRGHACGPA